MAGIYEGVRLPQGKTQRDCHAVLENFKCMFGETIEADVIQTILESNKWNVDEAAEDLMKIQADIEAGSVDSIAIKSRPGRQTHTNTSKAYSFNDNWKKHEHSRNSEFERPSYKPTFQFTDSWSQNNMKSSVEDVNVWKVVGAIKKNSHPNKETSPRYSGNVPNYVKKETSDESDHYTDEDRNSDCEKSKSSSDDGADVIIEEEKEFTINSDTFSADVLRNNLHSLNFTCKEFSSGSCAKSSTGKNKNKAKSKSISPKNKNDNTESKRDKILRDEYSKALKIKNVDDRIYDMVINGIKTMVLMRGAPGSGKSFAANALIKKINSANVFSKHFQNNAHIFSTDDYFNRKGKYEYDRRLLEKAHDWNRKRVEKALVEGRNPIIIDNTNIKQWEMQIYVVMGVQQGYHIEIFEPNTKWKWKLNELFKRNSHGVPKEKIKMMLEDYEKVSSVEELLKSFNLKYDNLRPPLLMSNFGINEASNQKKDKRKSKIDSDRLDQCNPTKISSNSKLSSTETLEDVYFKYSQNKDVTTKETADNFGQFIDNNTKKLSPEKYNKEKLKSSYSNTEPLPSGNGNTEKLSSMNCSSYKLLCGKNTDQLTSGNDNTGYSSYGNVNKENLTSPNPKENIMSKNYNHLKSTTNNNTKDIMSGNYNSEILTCSNNSSSIKGLLDSCSMLNESYRELLKENSSYLKSPSKSKNKKSDQDFRLEYIPPSDRFYEDYQIAQDIADEFESTLMMIVSKVKVLVLLRGCPGSGKTHLAKRLVDKANESGIPLSYYHHVLSVDDYFTSSSGYSFQRDKSIEAHIWNEKRCKLAMDFDISPIIIDNYNGEIENMKNYAELAIKNGFAIKILEPDTDWKYNENELLRRNIHDVVRMKLRYMLDKFVKNVTSKSLLEALNLNYSADKKPPLIYYDYRKGYKEFSQCYIYGVICVPNCEPPENPSNLFSSNDESVQNNQQLVNVDNNKTDFNKSGQSIEGNSSEEKICDSYFNSNEPILTKDTYKNIMKDKITSDEQNVVLDFAQENVVLKNNIDTSKSLDFLSNEQINNFSNYTSMHDNVIKSSKVDDKLMITVDKDDFSITSNNDSIKIRETVAANNEASDSLSLPKTSECSFVKEEIKNDTEVLKKEPIAYKDSLSIDVKNYGLKYLLQSNNKPELSVQDEVTENSSSLLNEFIGIECKDSVSIDVTNYGPRYVLQSNDKPELSVQDEVTKYSSGHLNLSENSFQAQIDKTSNSFMDFLKIIGFKQTKTKIVDEDSSENITGSIERVLKHIDTETVEFSNTDSLEQIQKSVVKGFPENIKDSSTGDLIKSEIKTDSVYQTICSEFKNPFDRICLLALCKVKVLVLIRGFYSTGKTALAHAIIERINKSQNADLIPLIYFEHVFIGTNMKLSFKEYVSIMNVPDPTKLTRVENAMKFNTSPIIVDDCHIKLLEMLPFVCLALKYGYIVEICEPDTMKRLNKEEFIERNIFDKNEANAWLKIYENDVSTRKFFNYFNLKYNPDTIPQIDYNLYNSVYKRLYPVDDETLCYPVNLSEKNTPIKEAKKNEISNISFNSSNVVDINQDEDLNSDKISTTKQEFSFSSQNRENKFSDSLLLVSTSLLNASEKTTLNNDNLITSNPPCKIREPINISDLSDSCYSVSSQVSDNTVVNERIEEKQKEEDVIDNDSEVCLSDKLFDSYSTCNESSGENTIYFDTEDITNENDVTNSVCDLKKISVNDWLTDTKKNALEKMQHFDKSSDSIMLLKSWDVGEEHASPDECSKDILSKPQRGNILPKKHNSVSNIFCRLSEKQKKLPKEFLKWTPGSDPPYDWYNDVKDTISGTTSNEIPKPPRKSNNDVITKSTNEANILVSSDDIFPVKKPKTSENVNDNLVTLLLKDVPKPKTKTNYNSQEEKNICNAEILSRMFPKVAPIYLKDLLEKCKGDLNWAAELLIEENRIADYSNAENAIQISQDASESTQSLTVVASDVNEFSQETNSSSKKVKKGSVKGKKLVNENLQSLKESIEKNIVMNQSCYSPDLLKLIKKRRGEYNPNEDIPFTLTPEEIAMVNDQTSDQIEDENFQSSDGDENDSGDNSTEDENNMELLLTKDIVSQLCESFGSPCLPKNMIIRDIKVQLPKIFAMQLHGFILDSFEYQMEEDNSQMQKMIAEDEDLARRVHELESRTVCSNQPSTTKLQEVIDMETALAIYKADMAKASQESSETFASRLGKSILLEKFPNIDKKAVQDLFSTNNYSLADTISTLVADQNSDMNLNDWEMELLQRAKMENMLDTSSSGAEASGCNPVSKTDQLNQAKMDFEHYRNEAEGHRQERAKCFEKAKDAFQFGNKNAASYYSHLANLHMQQIEKANSLAASALIYAHSSTSEVTLDLHFYKVKEALVVLDMFLDAGINRLIEVQKAKRVLYIITGRGLHSSNGKSKVKPAVMQKLKSRQITIKQVNPGMLSIVIFRNTPLSSS